MTVRHTVVAIQPIRLGQCRRTTGGSPLFFCMNGAEYRAMVSALASASPPGMRILSSS
jgi:hypothetical protein